MDKYLLLLVINAVFHQQITDILAGDAQDDCHSHWQCAGSSSYCCRKYNVNVWTVFVHQTTSVSHQTNLVGQTNVQIVLSAPLILIVVLHITAAIHVRTVVNVVPLV